MATVPYTIENQSGDSIVLRDNTILDGETYEIPLNESFYNDFNAGAFNRNFTGITITCTDNTVITRVEFWDVFNEIQNSNLINVNTVGIESLLDGIPTNVTDEDQRDSQFPFPVDGLKVYNERIGLTERFNSTFGLWVNANVLIIQNTLDLPVNRVVKFTSQAIINSIAYPDVAYVTANSERKLIEGVIIQKGKNNFAALAEKGDYYIEHGESILLGESVRAKTSGVNGDVGKIESGGGNGVLGVSLANSGATIGKNTLTLIRLTSTDRT